MTGHVFSVRARLRVARSLFGNLHASAFRPESLASCDTMVVNGWKRKTIYERIASIISAIKWAVPEEWVGPTCGKH